MNKIRFHRKPPLLQLPTTTRSLNATITRLSAQGLHEDVLLTFSSTINDTSYITTDPFTYPSLLKACISLSLFTLGRVLHQQTIVSGFSSDPYVSSSLVNLYAKFKNVEYARKVFDGMQDRNIVPWTAIIGCYSRSGDWKNAFFMYNAMRADGIEPTSLRILNLLCGLVESEHVRVLHACVVKSGFTHHVVLSNCLLSVYAKCGRVGDARELFEMLGGDRDAVSWNSLISVYSVFGDPDEVLKLFYRMRFEGVEPDQQTFGSLVSAIAREGGLGPGRVAHGQILVWGFESYKHVQTVLVGLYSKCGKVDDALRIHERADDKDAVFWTAMISGLVQNDSADKALKVFRQMLVSGATPSTASMACVLVACAQLGSKALGTSTHCYILRMRMTLDTPLQNALDTFYAKCGLLEQSFTIFSMIEERDVVSWNAVIVGYAQSGYLSKALSFFNEMRTAHQRPDSVTVVSLLQACASLGAHHQGKWCHSFVLRNGLPPCIRIRTALVDMYAKCGDLDSARKCFDQMHNHDSVSWGTIIAGYGTHGKGEAALEMFEKFLQLGLVPNSVIFLSALYACSHNGLVERGLSLFESMRYEYNIEPEIEHRGCIVDILCRAGRVQDAYDIYRKNFPEHAIDVLGILLDACRNYREEELAYAISKEISELEPEDAGKYVQVAHSFASVDRWDGVGKAWAQMRSLGLKKTPGWSSIEMQGAITPFFTSQSSHPQYTNMASALRSLNDYMKKLFPISEYEDFVVNSDVF